MSARGETGACVSTRTKARIPFEGRHFQGGTVEDSWEPQGGALFVEVKTPLIIQPRHWSATRARGSVCHIFWEIRNSCLAIGQQRYLCKRHCRRKLIKKKGHSL